MMDQSKYPFRWKGLRKLRGDYGGRNALICNRCDKQVFAGSHAGRPVDERYFFALAKEAATNHLSTHSEANL